jgi:hypothetical protein
VLRNFDLLAEERQADHQYRDSFVNDVMEAEARRGCMVIRIHSKPYVYYQKNFYKKKMAGLVYL